MVSVMPRATKLSHASTARSRAGLRRSSCSSVNLPSTQSVDKTQARAACAAIGGGWSLCTPDILCNDLNVYQYLANQGCMCNGGPTACGAGLANVYIHLEHTGTDARAYWFNHTPLPNCGSGTTCAASGSENLGAPLCCLGLNP